MSFLRLFTPLIPSCIVLLAAIATPLGWSPPSWSQTTTSPPLPCSWPLESTGRGLSNVAYPDTNATYWVMPVDTSTWQSMIVTGQYAQSRFFSFTTYYSPQQTNTRVVGDIIDANIAPDSGSTNPFAPGTAAAPYNYTITFDGNTTGNGNHVAWATNQTTYVIYRIYVADEGLDREAGVPLPNITLVDTRGSQHPLAQCSQAARVAAEAKTLIATLESGVTAATCPTGAAQSGAVTFTDTNSGEGGHFPNPVTTYYAARNLCLQADNVIVVRGQAPDFPNTYVGGTIYQPAFPGSIQVRYWSLCVNEEVTPGPVVDCRADYATQLDGQGFYTYVISRDDALSQTPPFWLPAGATWLQWGEPLIQNALAFRDMVPADGFTLTGNYLPTGVYCSKRLLIQKGWQACFTAAGLTPP